MKHWPIRVGLLDLDEDKPLIEVNGRLRPDYQNARVMVRTHYAPRRYVCLPALPGETLAERVREAAEADLAGAALLSGAERYRPRHPIDDLATVNPAAAIP